MSELSDTIRSRGHWLVRIRPHPYEPTRVPTLAKLEEIVGSTTVSLRGWDFPHTDPRAGARGLACVSNASEWEQFLEMWQFYRSGQFVDLSGLFDDWRDRSTLSPVPDGWQPGRSVGIFEIVFRYTEIFEFASRLAMTEAGSESMEISITFAGLNHRQLRMDDPSKVPFFRHRPAEIDEFPYVLRVDRSELVADARRLALSPAQRLFEQFGLDLNEQAIRSLQEDLPR